MKDESKDKRKSLKSYTTEMHAAGNDHSREQRWLTKDF